MNHQSDDCAQNCLTRTSLMKSAFSCVQEVHKGRSGPSRRLPPLMLRPRVA
jgi:hypothetical protein